MMAKIQLFFETLFTPLSWMPDFCLEVLGKVAIAISVIIIACFITKVVNVFK